MNFYLVLYYLSKYIQFAKRQKRARSLIAKKEYTSPYNYTEKEK